MQIARPILATIKSIRIQPLHPFSQHLVSSSARNYSKLQEIIESDQWPLGAYLSGSQVDKRSGRERQDVLGRGPQASMRRGCVWRRGFFPAAIRRNSFIVS
jgi:hypothetical protein